MTAGGGDAEPDRRIEKRDDRGESAPITELAMLWLRHEQAGQRHRAIDQHEIVEVRARLMRSRTLPYWNMPVAKNSAMMK